MCAVFSCLHPAVLSGRHASMMRDVGNLVEHISVTRRGVFPFWIQILLQRHLRRQFIYHVFESLLLGDKQVWKYESTHEVSSGTWLCGT